MRNKQDDSDSDYALLLKELSRLNVKEMELEEIMQVYGNLELAISNLNEEDKTEEILYFIDSFKFYRKMINEEMKAHGFWIITNVIDSYELDEYNIEDFTEIVVSCSFMWLMDLMFTLEKLAEESDKYDVALGIVHMEIANRAEEIGARC